LLPTILVDGWQFEFPLPGFGRADAVNVTTHEVVELKPATIYSSPRAFAKAEAQVGRYVEGLTATFGGTWTPIINTYVVTPQGEIIISR
jgi:hypothetical protein